MTVLPGDDRQGVFGAGTLDTLTSIVQERGLERVLLLTGKGSFTSSGASDVLPGLRAVAAIETWSDFETNPNVDDVVRGSRIAATFQPDAIVAVGGGSVLDMAKLLAAFIGLDPDEIIEAVRTNTVTGRTPALILVPTTSGSGSEATHFAVVYIGQEKFSVAHPALLPDVVIVDPDLTLSGSPYQKATSVIDAIAQAVESHWARGATDASRAFARDALSDLVPSAQAFVGGDAEAAVRAARGSHLAGRAIDISKTTGAHAMAYGLTKRHGVSHGHAVATTLGAFARAHAAAQPGDGAVGDSLASIAELIGAGGAAQVGDRLDEIARGLGLELRLRELGVPRSEIAVMAGEINRERLANNPIEMSTSELMALLETCW